MSEIDLVTVLRSWLELAPSGARLEVIESVIEELNRLYGVEQAGRRIAEMLVHSEAHGATIPTFTHPDVQTLYNGRVLD